MSEKDYSEKWEWVEVVSDRQARFFHDLGATEVRFGPTDRRDRKLHVGCDLVMAIDDSGGSNLEDFYRDGTHYPQVYLDVNKLKRLRKEW